MLLGLNLVWVMSVRATDGAPVIELSAKSALLVDAATGRIMYQKADEQSLPVASMSKMMTEYLVLEKIHKGELRWDTEVKISPYAAAVATREDLSNVPLNPNVIYKVRDLFEAVSIYSANAAASALAETVAGSEERFAGLMNEKAAELKLTGSHFVNSSGLEMTDVKETTPWAEGRNTMTAVDCAKLAYYLIRDFPEMLSFSSIPKKAFGPDAYLMINRNQMLPGLNYGYEGAEGLKTGYTEKAGYCLTGVFRDQNTLWITVIIGAPGSKERFEESRRLFEISKSYKREQTPSKFFYLNQKFRNNFKDGFATDIPVFIKDSVILLYRVGEEDPFELFFIPNDALISNGELKQAVRKDQIIGYCVFRRKDQSDQFIEEAAESRYRVPVYAVHDIDLENSIPIE